jgi:hypothetical protein
MMWRIIGVVEKFYNDGITIVNPPPYQARVLDLGTGAEKTLTQSEDLFCAGHTTLANGTILFAGGSTLLHNLGARVDRVEG